MKRYCGVWLGVVGLLAACAPALDWREVRPQDSGVTMLFPCKPDSHARRVVLGKQQVRLVLHACTAGASTWALAFADVGDPALVGEALNELGVVAQTNLGASHAQALSLEVDGATPNPQSRRIEFVGHMPDGRQVTEQVAVFTKGLRVYQATALSGKLEPEAVDTFFGNLRVAP
jgi:hypothetical protein